MARPQNRLTMKRCSQLTQPGLHSDGGNLYLDIGPSGAKSWAFVYYNHGKRTQMGLGPYPTVGLADARAKALDCRKLRLEGKDPLAEHRRALLQRIATRSFRECAGEYIAAHKSEWRGGENETAWVGTLTTYAYPLIGEMPVAAVDTPDILRVLGPIWNTKTVTAGRLRGRIEAILDAAVAAGHRPQSPLNPARWRHHLEHLLAAPAKTKKHLAAVPYSELPALMTRLRQDAGIVAAALELTILCVCRTDEVLQAPWSEFDLEKRVWTLPAERMKAEREHRVPLTDPALAVLNRMSKLRTNDYVFPGRRGGGWLHERRMLQLLQRLAPGYAVHGMRSAFTDWAVENTSFTKECRDLALAHRVSDKVEEAYRRSDLFEQRRRLAENWSRHLAGASDTVVTLPERVVLG